MFAVAAHAQCVGHHPLRAFACTGSGNGALHGGQRGHEIGAIALVAAQAVATAAVHEAGGKFLIVRGGVGELVIGHHDDHGQLLHGNEVHGLVCGTYGCGAIADAGHTHAAGFALESLGQHHACHHGNHGPQVRNRHRITAGGVAPVHIAVASAHVAINTAQVSSCAFQHAFAPGAAPGLLTDKGIVHVLPAGQENRLAGGNGLMPAPQEHTAENLARLVQGRYLGVKSPRHDHGVVGFPRCFLQVDSVHVVHFTAILNLLQAETGAQAKIKRWRFLNRGG